MLAVDSVGESRSLDDPARLVAQHAHGDALVERELVDRELAELHERREAGAVVVERATGIDINSSAA